LLGYFAGQAYLAVARTIGHNIRLAIIMVVAVVVLLRVVKHRHRDREASKISG
jgi:membrane protein DedA with SNARE-associated domain